MKKIIGLLSFVTLFQMSFAQDLKKVTTNILLGKFDAAKEEYDKAVAKKASLGTTAEGYYLKARINGALAKDASMASKYPNAYADMRKALDEYMKLESNFSTAKDNGPDPFFDVYFKAFKEGVDAFNAKKWKEAATSFDEAVKFSDIVFSQGWSSSKQKFDTTSLMYAGYANQNAGNMDASNVYYKRMVDANIKTPDALDIYRFLLMQFISKKDQANFEKYYAISVAAYPSENWFEYKSDFIEKHFTMDEKIKMYDKMLVDGSMNEFAAQMFGDMFMAGKTLDGLSNETAEIYILKAQEAYKKAYNFNANNYAAAFNVGISYYNQYTVLDDKYGENIRALQNLNSNRPVAPKDPKKKLQVDAQFKAQVDSVKKLNANLDAPIKEKVDAAIEWIEKAYNNIKDKPKLERTEKSVAARSVDFLATLYAFKRDKLKGKDQKASDEFDAKYNYYDKLHDKYQ
ncbi:MAG: hypothetical protein EBV82_08135, partial [Chitinophagia bacterium]|nr:hypothetical protein [Chitinophagia bacterium]